GWMSDRSQTAGPKMYLAELGWFLPVLLRNGDNIVRFLPSAPTAKAFNFIAPSICRRSLSPCKKGWVLVMSLKTSSDKLSRPVSVLGHGMSFSERYRSNSAVLKVNPS